MTDFPTDSDVELAPVTELSKPQRRVLGVLLEKAFTTPEYYPLTLKAATGACNQKSNRSPVTNYGEDFVADVMDELRRIGLVGIVYTESARSERYRHYMRKRFDFTEPQLAILTELLLRGRQTLGELRARASRMVPIENLDQLRQELRGLLDDDRVQASGPLERRGVEVDHNFYRPNENASIRPAGTEKAAGATGGSPSSAGPTASSPTAAATASDESPATAVADHGATSPHPHSDGPSQQPSEDVDHAAVAELGRRVEALAATVEQFRLENKQLRDDLESVRDELRQQAEQVEDLRRDLGG